MVIASFEDRKSESIAFRFINLNDGLQFTRRRRIQEHDGTIKEQRGNEQKQEIAINRDFIQFRHIHAKNDKDCSEEEEGAYESRYE